MVWSCYLIKILNRINRTPYLLQAKWGGDGTMMVEDVLRATTIIVVVVM